MRTAAAALLLLAGAGCTVDALAGEPTPSTVDASAPATAVAASDARLPTGVIGSARVAGLDGVVLAVVEVVSDGTDELEVRLSELAPWTGRERQVLFAPTALADDQSCYDTGVRYDVGTPERPAGWSGVLYVGGEMVGDPSFFDEVVFTVGPDPVADWSSLDCIADVVGRGGIEWMFPPLRADLAPADSGATGGARGEVEVAGGRPVSYTVAADDLIDEVAARFGITRDDLFYLNPIRMPSPMRETLEVGEVLNLSVERR